MKQPLVSVVFCVYNGEDYLRQAVTSVLDQTFPDFELILIDDGSSDGTQKIMKEIDDPRVIRVRNEVNLSLVNSLNKGLRMARGPLIARMDADDITHPNRFEKEIAYLEKHPEVGVLGAMAQNVDASGVRISETDIPLEHEMIVWELFFGTPIVHPTVMMRRDVVMREGGYNPAFIHVEDSELWSRLVSVTRFANIPEVLHTKRVHKGSIGSTKEDIQRRSSAVVRKKYFRHFAGVELPHKIAQWFIAPETALSQEDEKKAREALERIFSAFVSFGISGEIKGALERKLEEKMLMVSMGSRDKFRKEVYALLKWFLPAHVRHGIRKSSVGRYVERHFMKWKT